MSTRVLHVAGHGPYTGALPGTYGEWRSGSSREIPSESARLLLARHPDRFARVTDRAIRHSAPLSAVPEGVASRHWRTLSAEVARGDHDAYLAQLAESDVSETVRRAITERTRALTSGAVD